MSPGLLCVILGHLTISAFTHVLARGVLRDEGLPPEIVVAGRAAVASLVLLPLGRLGGPSVRTPWTRADVLRLVACAALAVPVNQLAFATGLKHTHATHGALLFCLTPLCVGALATVLEGARTPRGAWLGTGAALVGVAIVVSPGLRASLGGREGAEILRGDLILLVAVVAWSLVTVLSRPLLRRLPSFALSRLLLLIGATLLLPFVVDDVASFAWRSLSPRAAGVIVFMGVGTSVTAYLLWNMLLRRLGSLRAAALVNLQPVAVGLLAWPLLGEPITVELFGGGALVLAGVLQAQRAVARAHAEALVAAADDPPLAA